MSLMNITIHIFIHCDMGIENECKYSGLLAPAVTVGETEEAMDSASVPVFTSSFAYNFVRK